MVFLWQTSLTQITCFFFFKKIIGIILHSENNHFQRLLLEPKKVTHCSTLVTASSMQGVRASPILDADATLSLTFLFHVLGLVCLYWGIYGHSQ